MSLRGYTTITIKQPKGIAGLKFAAEFSKGMDVLFSGIESAMQEHELNSLNDPMSLGVYTVNADIFALYNSELTDLVMLQLLFEKLEEIRDNEKKTLQERAYADVIHQNLTAAYVSSGLATVIYENR